MLVFFIAYTHLLADQPSAGEDDPVKGFCHTRYPTNGLRPEADKGIMNLLLPGAAVLF